MQKNIKKSSAETVIKIILVVATFFFMCLYILSMEEHINVFYFLSLFFIIFLIKNIFIRKGKGDFLLLVTSFVLINVLLGLLICFSGLNHWMIEILPFN